jgi:hypothetical protein
MRCTIVSNRISLAPQYSRRKYIRHPPARAPFLRKMHLFAPQMPQIKPLILDEYLIDHQATVTAFVGQDMI